jgi:hypothetical protein
MVSIPKHVQEFLIGKMAWVATAAGDGLPNVTPKGGLKMLDDQHVAFPDLYSLKTRQNLEQNPRIAVTVIDPASAKCYQIKGTVEMIASGPLYEQLAEEWKQSSPSAPSVKYVVKITVESVYDESVGAGKQIA